MLRLGNNTRAGTAGHCFCLGPVRLLSLYILSHLRSACRSVSWVWPSGKAPGWEADDVGSIPRLGSPLFKSCDTVL